MAQGDGHGVRRVVGLGHSTQVKQAVVGYGSATKHQVQDMTKRLLHLNAIPKPADAADAIAIALCHARSSTSLLAQANAQNKLK